MLKIKPTGMAESIWLTFLHECDRFKEREPAIQFVFGIILELLALSMEASTTT